MNVKMATNSQQLSIASSKTNKQPELTENQTVWKSNNQGVKEETYIQTGRRGRDRKPGGEHSQQGSS